MINLETTVFNLPEIVNQVPNTKTWIKNKPLTVADFGTIFIGDITDEDKEISNPQGGAPIFTCPSVWNISHILKALGAFPSTSQARKNGWDFEIPEGISVHVIRVNKIKGEIWIHKGSN